MSRRKKFDSFENQSIKTLVKLFEAHSGLSGSFSTHIILATMVRSSIISFKIFPFHPLYDQLQYL